MSTLLHLHRVLAEAYAIMISIWNAEMFMNMILFSGNLTSNGVSVYAYISESK